MFFDSQTGSNVGWRSVLRGGFAFNFLLLRVPVLNAKQPRYKMANPKLCTSNLLIVFVVGGDSFASITDASISTRAARYG